MPDASVSEVVVTDVSETPTLIITRTVPVEDFPTTVADLYCLVNADMPECRPSTQPSGPGRG